MGLESDFNGVWNLNAANPVGATDRKSAGDEHIRGIKTAILYTFPGVTGAVTATHTELNYTDGVTSNIQTQLDTKAPTAGPTFTGTVTAPTITNTTALTCTGTVTMAAASAVTVPTVTAGDSSTNAASTAFVAGTAFSSALPAISGTTGQMVRSNGSVASWGFEYDITTTATSKTLANREGCSITASGQTLTLPASPAAGYTVRIVVPSGISTTIGRNSSPIMATAEDMTVDLGNVTVTLVYQDATRGWWLV